MEKPVYPIEVSEDGLWYEFDSAGKQEITKKAIAFYINADKPNVAEVVFGNLMPDGTIDVLSHSKNNDMVSVLSTVVHTIRYFWNFIRQKLLFLSAVQ